MKSSILSALLFFSLPTFSAFAATTDDAVKCFKLAGYEVKILDYDEKANTLIFRNSDDDIMVLNRNGGALIKKDIPGGANKCDDAEYARVKNYIDGFAAAIGKYRKSTIARMKTKSEAYEKAMDQFMKCQTIVMTFGGDTNLLVADPAPAKSQGSDTPKTTGTN